MKNEWDWVEGPEFGWLGHFNSTENLTRGHNTTYAPEPPGVAGMEMSLIHQGAAAIPTPQTSQSGKQPGGSGGGGGSRGLQGIGDKLSDPLNNTSGGRFLRDNLGMGEYGSDVGADFGGGGDF